MLIADLITEEVPPLKSTDTIDQALHWMEEFKVTHLAVIKGKALLGLVSEDDLLDANADPSLPIEQSKVHFIKPVVHQSQHAYEALKLMAGMNLTLLPVLDEKEQFAGSVTYKSALEKFTGFSAIKDPGGIIELEMHDADYSLVQIAGIVESNDAKILSLYVSSMPDSKKIEITIKVNKEDLTRILQTFYRYDYNVKASYHQSEFEEDLKGRFNEFMRFLNI
ncbi:MAG: CBS domain-containing protein [Bacteroidota bacterium]|nr:CBS domain-containing protein [Bacteroidota bacterium]